MSWIWWLVFSCHHSWPRASRWSPGGRPAHISDTPLYCQGSRCTMVGSESGSGMSAMSRSRKVTVKSKEMWRKGCTVSHLQPPGTSESRWGRSRWKWRTGAPPSPPLGKPLSMRSAVQMEIRCKGGGGGGWKPIPNGMCEFFSEYKPLIWHLICTIRSSLTLGDS